MLKEEIRRYWEKHPNALSIAEAKPVGSREFYQAIESHRYKTEPSIPEMAEFEKWSNRLVLELGCGIGTDLRQFAKNGALTVGIDLTAAGIALARQGFAAFALPSMLVIADAEMLPFNAGVFDLVYSHGVIHHTPETALAVSEIHRVLRDGGGEARIMVYHRNSFFQRIFVGIILHGAIYILHRLFPTGKVPPFVRERIPPMIRSGYDIVSQKGYHRDLLLAFSTEPSFSGEGNFNPLSKTYSRSEIVRMFARFKTCQTFVRELYGAPRLTEKMRKFLGRRFGWFLYVRAAK